MELHGRTEHLQSSLQIILPKLLWKRSDTAERAKEGQCHLLLTPFQEVELEDTAVRSLHKRLQTVTFSTDSSNDSSASCYSFTLIRNEDIFGVFFFCFITVYYFLSNSYGLWIIKAAQSELFQTKNPGDLQNPINPLLSRVGYSGLVTPQGQSGISPDSRCACQGLCAGTYLGSNPDVEQDVLEVVPIAHLQESRVLPAVGAVVGIAQPPAREVTQAEGGRVPRGPQQPPVAWGLQNHQHHVLRIVTVPHAKHLLRYRPGFPPADKEGLVPEHVRGLEHNSSSEVSAEPGRLDHDQRLELKVWA